jgi:drug/metabolite transporter (DMT)-like permease
MSSRWLGLCYGLLAALIWGGQAIVGRLAAYEDVTPADVTVIRFTVAGIVLLPIALRFRPILVGTTGWLRVLVLFLLSGSTYNMVLIGGLAYAPALDSAAIACGVIPIATAVLAYYLAGERLTVAGMTCLGTIAIGLALFAWQSLSSGFMSATWRGHLLFVTAGLMWAGFTTLSKRWNVDPVGITSSICVISLATLPFLPLLFRTGLTAHSSLTLIFYAVYMGLLVGVASLICYQRAIAILGAAYTGMMVSLAPVVAGIGGALVLEEMPAAAEFLGMVLVVGGLALAPLLQRRFQHEPPRLR